MLRFLVAPERPWSAIIIHFAAELNIVAHETCNLIPALQKSLAPVVAETVLATKTLRTGTALVLRAVANGLLSFAG